MSSLFCSNYLWHLMLFQHFFYIKVWSETLKQHSKSCLDACKPIIQFKQKLGFFFYHFEKKHAVTLQMWSMRSIQCAYLGFRSGLGFPGHKARLCQFIYRLQRNGTTDTRYCRILPLLTHQAWEVLWMASQMLQFAIIDKDLHGLSTEKAQY